MRGLAIMTRDLGLGGRGEMMELEGVPVFIEMIEAEPPNFDPGGQRDRVLVKVRAFSCNYRDKGLILRTATHDTASGYYLIGSEFVAEVVATGDDVTDLSPGDRVMGNNAFPDSGAANVLPGVPTNHSSRELLVLPRIKLARVPDGMSDGEAASFSIGGQTTWSMARRLSLKPGDAVLVTAAKSNTSLFAIAALRRYGVDVYALSTSDRFADQLYALGIKELIVFDPLERPLVTHPPIVHILSRIGGFAGVIDPYADLYLAHMPAVMAMGGRYVTCGFYNQYLGMVGKPSPRPPVEIGAAFATIMMKNLSIIGNCIGTTDDLDRALGDYAAGHLKVIVDSEFSGGDAIPFLERTYKSPERFGKVVFRYD